METQVSTRLISPSILLIGGGGHSKVVIDALRGQPCHILGIVDAQLPIGTRIDSVAVIGRDHNCETLFKKAKNAFIAIGSITSTDVRRSIYCALHEIGFEFPTIIHPRAIVASTVVLGEGAFVGAGAVIQTGASIGSHAIINTGAVIDHDCIIGDFTHIGPGAVLSGAVSVGDDVLVGTGSVVIEGRKIGSRTLIGAGSVVVSDIPGNCTAFGSPCRIKL